MRNYIKRTNSLDIKNKPNPYTTSIYIIIYYYNIEVKYQM